MGSRRLQWVPDPYRAGSAPGRAHAHTHQRFECGDWHVKVTADGPSLRSFGDCRSRTARDAQADARTLHPLEQEGLVGLRYCTSAGVVDEREPQRKHARHRRCVRRPAPKCLRSHAASRAHERADSRLRRWSQAVRVGAFAGGVGRQLYVAAQCGTSMRRKSGACARPGTCSIQHRCTYATQSRLP
jgi:hypothetical protein